MEIYVKRELFYRIGSTIYITDKSGKGHSRKEIEKELGINVRKQQAMLKDKQKKTNNSEKVLNPMESWSLELICKLAHFLGYTVEELLDEKCIEEYKKESDKKIMEVMERRKIW